MKILSVATLGLGSRPRQGLAKVRAKSELESHISYSQECKKVRGNEPPHSQVNSHFGSWSPNGLLNFQREIARVKTNGLICYLYHWKLLELRCLKWVRMTHLDTPNASYGQNKGRESNWQFDSQPLKVGNRPDFIACRWRATYHWNSFDKR
jgi:hypothetical protein